MKVAVRKYHTTVVHSQYTRGHNIVSNTVLTSGIVHSGNVRRLCVVNLRTNNVRVVFLEVATFQVLVRIRIVRVVLPKALCYVQIWLAAAKAKMHRQTVTMSSNY